MPFCVDGFLKKYAAVRQNGVLLIMDVGLQVALSVILLIICVLLSCADSAFVAMNDKRMLELAAEGKKKAIRLAKIADKPDSFIAGVRVALSMTQILGCGLSIAFFAPKLSVTFVKLGLEATVAYVVSAICTGLCAGFVFLLIGDLLPSKVASRKAENTALAMSGFIVFIAGLLRPYLAILNGLSGLLSRLFGVNPREIVEEDSEEEIKMMVDVGTQKGEIDTQEQEIIRNVFEFDDITIGELATHRTEIDFLDREQTEEEWDEVIHSTRHSLYPVCEGSIDNVVGILNAKDYFRLKDKSRESVLENAVRPAYFVPETAYADVTLKQMRHNRRHFAIVLDEYGGTMGVITIIDLLERLVGDLDDEETPEDEIEKLDIEKLDDETYRINGAVSLSEVGETLGVELPTEEFETFGGYVFAEYGSIPQDGSEIELDAGPLHVKVTLISEHRVEDTIVSVIPVVDEEENEEKE